MEAAAPTVSVIVPARDGARSLPGLLSSLAGQTMPSDRFEVIVVDNGSRDETAEVARRHGAVVIDEPRPNRALARNAGAERARGALLAFVDADCVAAPRWIEWLAGCLGRCELAAGPVRVSTSVPGNRVERFDASWRFPQERYVSEGFAASANLGVRRECFASVGGFDPGYRHIGEDVDFCLRAGAAGYEIGFCPEAEVSHPAESSLRPVLRRGFRQGFAGTQLARRFPERFGPRWRHPRPLVNGELALRSVGADPGGIEPEDLRAFTALAKAEYACRLVGSLWGELSARGSSGNGP